MWRRGFGGVGDASCTQLPLHSVFLQKDSGLWGYTTAAIVYDINSHGAHLNSICFAELPTYLGKSVESLEAYPTGCLSFTGRGELEDPPAEYGRLEHHKEKLSTSLQARASLLFQRGCLPQPISWLLEEKLGLRALKMAAVVVGGRDGLIGTWQRNSDKWIQITSQVASPTPPRNPQVKSNRQHNLSRKREQVATHESHSLPLPLSALSKLWAQNQGQKRSLPPPQFLSTIITISLHNNHYFGTA